MPLEKRFQGYRQTSFGGVDPFFIMDITKGLKLPDFSYPVESQTCDIYNELHGRIEALEAKIARLEGDHK